MQFNITPVMAKISDSQESNLMNVYINGDTGEACSFVYNVGYMEVASSGQGSPIFQAMLPNTAIKIAGDDYAAYSNASTSNDARFRYAAQYVCGKYPSIVLAAS